MQLLAKAVEAGAPATPAGVAQAPLLLLLPAPLPLLGAVPVALPLGATAVAKEATGLLLVAGEKAWACLQWAEAVAAAKVVLLPGPEMVPGEEPL